jgi:predicted ATPase
MSSPKDTGPPAITSIGVKGFKSIRDSQTIAIAPLTVLAGANSSGKSSVIQPLLLMKQTIEAPYDPGPLLIKGPFSDFNLFEQLLFHSPYSRDFKQAGELQLNFSTEMNVMISIIYHKIEAAAATPIQIKCEDLSAPGFRSKLTLQMTDHDIQSQLEDTVFKDIGSAYERFVFRDRCFLRGGIRHRTDASATGADFTSPYIQNIQYHLTRLFVLGPTRGLTSRTHTFANSETILQSHFHYYVPSYLFRWGEESREKLDEIGESLKSMGLTWKVEARVKNDSEIEIFVARSPIRKKSKTAEKDLVNIADVGVGVSYALPVVTALIAAMPNQLVYIDQPELHLHPRAQVAMATLLAKAAKRGVRVIVETHSSLLILAIQTLVAEKELTPDQVKLHWFQRDDDGATTVSTSELDEAGRYGEWPVDFDDVMLKEHGRYLDSVHKFNRSKSKSSSIVGVSTHRS